MKKVEIFINGKKIKAEENKTILEVALENDIYIPNLCWHPELEPTGTCRMCLVEIEGAKALQTACTTKIQNGMNIKTDTEELKKLRKMNLWLILSQINGEIPENSQFKKVIDHVGIYDFKFEVKKPSFEIYDNPLFTRNQNLCILCGRCVKICQEVRKTGVLGFINRGIDTKIGTANNKPLSEEACRFCLACVEVCPTGALKDKIEFTPETRQKTLLPCSNTCPAGIEVFRYVRLIAEGKFQDSLNVIREKVPFPLTLGFVCPHPCEDACRRGYLNQPIAIRILKRFVAERDDKSWMKKINKKPETGKKVAIIGSGPAGLTCAWFLKILGHEVFVFEKMEKPGGMMRYGIPRYRLPEEILDSEIEIIKSIGVIIKTNAEIKNLEELFDDGFDAVFLSAGAWEGTKMQIPGEDLDKVYDGISLLQKISKNEKIEIGKTALVVGGGNVAIDVARSLKRLGVKVTILYRRTKAQMPALPSEVEEAEKEGIEIKILTNPVEIKSCSGKLSIVCIKMELGEPDESGRKRPVPVKGSEFEISTDAIVMAIGQKVSIPKEFELKLDKKGRVLVDENLMTSKRGVFAGGDCVAGPQTVIEAIEYGRKGASFIDKFLGGDGDISLKLSDETEESPCLGREERFAFKERIKIQTLPPDERIKNFSCVEFSLNENDAIYEAKRCLRCQLRLKIKKVPLP